MKPVNPENQYKVALQKNGKYRYASTQPRVENKKTGKVSYARKHWGTVDNNMKFHPGLNYLIATEEERKKLIFPSDWDLSEIQKPAEIKKQRRKAIEAQDENKLYGDIMLMETVAENTGIRDDLLDTFEGNEEVTDAVLSLAMYLISGKGNLNQFSLAQNISKYPTANKLTSSTITRLTQAITNQHKMDLFRYRANRLGKEELCAVDSTTISTYGNTLADIKWGKNKEHLPLPQTTEVVVYTLTNHSPIYYQSFPGNIPDSRTLKTIVNELESAGFKNLVLITDRGYDSISNVEMLIDKNQPAIMGAKVNQKLISEKIPSFGHAFGTPEGMEFDVKEQIFYSQYDLNYQYEDKHGNAKKAENLKLNLYFDVKRFSQDLLNLQTYKAEQEEGLKELVGKEFSDKDKEDLKKDYWLYNLILDKETKVLYGYEFNLKKYNDYLKRSGYFANITNLLDFSPMEANIHYLLRDEQEKYFWNMKGPLQHDRHHSWSEDGKSGRDFIIFVAEVILCQIQYIYRTKLTKVCSSTIELLNTMRSIRYIEHPNSTPVITPFVGKQLIIAEAFGMNVPSDCTPDNLLRKTKKSN